MPSDEPNWCEDESFWERTFPFMFSEAGFTAAIENVPKLVALSGIAGGAVLDLACGPGRYAVPLAKAGFAVSGVDRTRFLLDKARQHADREAASVKWIECDMRDFARPGTFDLALNLFTSFGYFDDWVENRRVLEHVLASLKPGGVFIFDTVGKESLAQRFMATLSDPMEDGTILVRRHRIIDDWSRIEIDWILLDGERATTFRIRHWLYSGWELREFLTSVGFGEVQLFGGFDGSPYAPGAQRLIAVARKPAA